MTENKKTIYESPEMEAIRFSAEDVITNSNCSEPAELDEIKDK